MSIDKQHLQRAFFDYASSFDLEDARIKLKLEHMLSVADIAADIALTNGFDDETIMLAYICGLYHDVGRFEQVRRYGTFSDARSVDHAELSCSIAESEGLLSFLGPEKEQMELVAIRNHNRFAIDPDVTDEQTLTLCRIIRDADKVDIYRVFAVSDIEDITGCSIAQLNGCTITPEVYGTCMTQSCIRSDARVTPLDKMVGALAFIYDVNYAASFKMILEQGYYREVFSRLDVQDGATREQIDTLVSDAEAYAKAQAG